MSRTIIIGTGSALPERVLTNLDLEKLVDTTDEWITTRTGIKTRRIAGPGENTSNLASRAAREALAMARLTPADLDMIIVGTITPDMTMPSCACLVQKELGACNAFAFDLNAACSGFLYSLDVADKYLRASPAMKILVAGAETLSSRVNWQDRNTCVLFGDGAGACVVTGGETERGILGSRLFADGSLWELLHMEAAPSQNPELRRPEQEDGCIRMVGREVFKNAVRAMASAIRQVLAQEGVEAERLALVIPHQANIRILQSLADHLALPMEKIYVNVDKYGNTSAATIPIAIDEANRAGRLRDGDLLLLCSFGGGFTWGATLIRW
ncbi:MAG: beta-ketoacyl-ACP synthase III [Thermodesulfobacteriota bacterium]